MHLYIYIYVSQVAIIQLHLITVIKPFSIQMRAGS